MDVLKLHNASKRFGNFTAVNGVSFSVVTGEIVGFVGPNGAGKTTAINMILGFLRTSGGEVQVLGQTIKPQNAHKTHSKIGYAAGDMALFDNLTGKQYLEYFAGVQRSAPRQKELIQLLAPKLTQKIGNLSRGNKQKIALVSALQHEPELIILDEPTSGLDPLMQKTFLELILGEKKRGATVFMSSHILSEVAEVSDRVIFLRDGKVIIDQPMAKIRGKEGKVVTITAQNPITSAGLPKGSTGLKMHRGKHEFHYSGDAATLATWLAKQKPINFTVETQTLDDLFAHLYEGEGDI